MFTLQQLSAIRDAEIRRIVQRFLPPQATLLEIGAGTGQQALELRRHGFDVTAIEIPDSTYTGSRVLPVIDYDGRTIPLSDASVDVVFSSNVLEHVPDLTRMHDEIRRVLKPNGFCVHVLPTHAWRFWTTLTAYLDALALVFRSGPQLFPRQIWRTDELKRLGRAWYITARRAVGICLPRRHGERGNIISELWLFHPGWWRRNFRDNGFTVVYDEPMGLFYTGNMLLGDRLSLRARERVAGVLGSACHAFKLVPTNPADGG